LEQIEYGYYPYKENLRGHFKDKYILISAQEQGVV